MPDLSPVAALTEAEREFVSLVAEGQMPLLAAKASHPGKSPAEYLKFTEDLMRRDDVRTALSVALGPVAPINVQDENQAKAMLTQMAMGVFSRAKAEGKLSIQLQAIKVVYEVSGLKETKSRPDAPQAAIYTVDPEKEGGEDFNSLAKQLKSQQGDRGRPD